MWRAKEGAIAGLTRTVIVACVFRSLHVPGSLDFTGALKPNIIYFCFLDCFSSQSFWASRKAA
jgi:hypothetical protein